MPRLRPARLGCALGAPQAHTGVPHRPRGDAHRGAPVPWLRPASLSRAPRALQVHLPPSGEAAPVRSKRSGWGARGSRNRRRPC
eukprot:14864686-Alexandrium_andersonii.AAC.1